MTQVHYEAQVAERGRQQAEAIARRPTSLYGGHATMLVDGDADAVSQILCDSFGSLGSGPFARNAAGTFDVFAAMSLVCRWGDRLSDEALGHVRQVFAAGVLHRGNTENHWLMHYTGTLLAAERWGTDVAQWWNGLPPAAVAAEAGRWLTGIIERSARCGHHEYDSPQYHPWHLLPMMVLAEHAADAGLRRQAGQMATLLVADMALEWFAGSWAGGHAREGYRENTWTRSGHVAALQYLFFGGETFDPELHGHPLGAIAIAGAWRPPALLSRIALEGERPRVVKKTKAPREIFRHVRSAPKPVRKYTYLSPSFALGSTQLGLPGAPAGPIDLVSWDLTWTGPQHNAKIAATHPFASPGRFSAFLDGVPQTIGRGIAAHKPYLQSPDRLFGASPYERMVQHEGAILILNRIPPEDANPYVNLYLPKSAAWTHADGGWLCADMGGFYLGLRPIGAHCWDIILEAGFIDGWLLRLTDPYAGLALEAVEAAGCDGGYDGFVERRGAAALDLSGWPDPGSAALTTTGGHRLELQWPAGGADVHRIDGQLVDYDSYGLYEAPGVDAPMGTGRVRFGMGDDAVELDFDIDPAAESLPMRVIG